MSLEPEITSAHDDVDLKRVLGPVQLIALGIGAIIGAGIFVATGQAAALYAGPAVILSFAFAGVGCLFAGLCYAEISSMIPVAGSAYSFAYATLGRFLAWVIGWDLILEYLAAAAAVAVGWSGYFGALMAEFGWKLPLAYSSAPITIDAAHNIGFSGAVINLPAAFLVMGLTTLLVIGMRATATFNALMVLLKLIVVVMVIVFGIWASSRNISPRSFRRTPAPLASLAGAAFCAPPVSCSLPISGSMRFRSRHRKRAIHNATCPSAFWARC